MTKAKQLGIKEFPYEEYDSNGNLVYREYSSGYWEKNDYDSNNEIYYEDSTGFWIKNDYDSNGNKIYYENSNGNGLFRYYEGIKLIKTITLGYKEHYLAYKRNLKLNTLLND